MHRTSEQNIQIFIKMSLKKFFQILLYNGFMCEHVYKNFGLGPCPKCGLPTHDINWEEQNKMYWAYKEKVGYFYNVNTWWSI